MPPGHFSKMILRFFLTVSEILFQRKRNVDFKGTVLDSYKAVDFPGVYMSLMEKDENRRAEEEDKRK